MNQVNLIGNITRDPEVKYTDSQMAVLRFSVAINRGKDREGNDRGADYPNCVAFGKTAENIGRFFKKGRKIGITGHIQTGSYEKNDGTKVYTTDVMVDRFYFCDSASSSGSGGTSSYKQPAGASGSVSGIPEGFEMVDESDIPF